MVKLGTFICPRIGFAERCGAQNAMKVSCYRLRDHDFGDAWGSHVEDRWDYEAFLNDNHWRKDWISFNGIVHHAATDRVYCAITSFDADGVAMWHCHDVDITAEGVLYAGENDDPYRSGCLWEIEI